MQSRASYKKKLTFNGSFMKIVLQYVYFVTLFIFILDRSAICYSKYGESRFSIVIQNNLSSLQYYYGHFNYSYRSYNYCSYNYFVVKKLVKTTFCLVGNYNFFFLIL